MKRILLINPHSLNRNYENTFGACVVPLIKVSSIDEAAYELQSAFYVLVILAVDTENSCQLLKLVRELRKTSNIPIEVIAGESVDSSILPAALYEGADHFLQLPIPPKQITAFIFSLIRTYTRADAPLTQVGIYAGMNILISKEHRDVFVHGKKIELMNKEFDILLLLFKNPARVLTYEYIFQDVWGELFTADSKAKLVNQIRRLRKKLRVNSEIPNYIRNVHEIGYCFTPSAN